MASQKEVDKTKLALELNKKIEFLKSQLQTPGNFIYDIYNSPSPKKDLILKWAQSLEELHNLGEFKEPITEISTVIHDELKEMKLDRARAWAWEVLPHKYKNLSKIHNEDEDLVSSVQPSEISSKDLAYKCQQANKGYIRRLDKTIDILKKVKHNLETRTIFVPKLDQRELGEFYLIWDHSTKRLEEILDGREKVLPSQQHILFFCLAEATKTFTFSQYVRHIRDLANLTPKQAGKILRGYIKHVQDLYNPKTRMEACEVGYYGIECDECGSWRVEYKYNSDSQNYELFCHACKTWHQKVPTEKLLIKTP